MSFQVGNGLSGTVKFRPAVWNLEWDGVTEAKVSFELACVNTASTYEAIAYPVHTNLSIVQCPFDWTFIRGHYPGDRFWEMHTVGNEIGDGTCELEYAPDVSLPITMSSNVATIIFSDITNTSQVHSWVLRSNNGTSTHQHVTGRIKVIRISPWLNSPGSITNLASVTPHSPCE